MAFPEITVLMSACNAERFLKNAVHSILAQSYSNFEFIIIDDGSSDNTWNMLTGLKDSRIKLVRNRENKGLTRSLNEGLKLARGTYIARMDADDISLPRRLEQQKIFLDKHPATAMVGCWIEVIDENGQKTKRFNFPIVPYLLRWRLLFTNIFAHSAVMFRKDAALDIGGYSEKMRYAQDYDLWSRISIHWEVANIPDVLVQWRFWEQGISAMQAKKQEEAAVQIAKRNISYLIGRYPDEVYFEYIRGLYTNKTNSLQSEDIEELNRNTGELLDRFCKMFNYTSKTVPVSIKIEIATHSLLNLFRTPCSISEKGPMIFCWIKKLKPNIIFRIFPFFFARRKEVGTRIQDIFRQH